MRASARWLSLLVLVLAVGPACHDGATCPPPAHPTTATSGSGGREASAEPVVAEGAAATFARYAVASGHPQASAAGAAVLAKGGNAADAAVATMLALGVASPASSGLGGGGFALYFDASTGEVTFLDFREQAPASARPDMLDAPRPNAGAEGDTDESSDEDANLSGLSAGVPGEPRGMQALLDRFGSMTRAEVAAPAIRLAEEGFEPEAHGAELIEALADDLRDGEPGAAWLDALHGAKDPAHATLTNPKLAATLREFADDGPTPFYEGHIAEDVVRAVNAAGGHLTMADLKGYAVDTREPLRGKHLGLTWVTAPPESAGGFTLLAALGLLERWQPAPDRPPWTDAVRLHATAEALRGPFIDRARYFGDPRFVDVPVAALLAPARLARRARVFEPDRARPPADYDLPLTGAAPEPAAAPPEKGTSHLCVVDAAGNVAAVTTTVNWPFGIREAVDGFFINNELDDFTHRTGTEPQQVPAWAGGGANRPGPGRRPVSTMTPTIAFDAAGRPVLCIGASGGRKIVTAVLQVAYRIVALGQAPGPAVDAPRIHAGASGPVTYEPALPDAVVQRLSAMGHDPEPMQYRANVQAIEILRPTSEGSDVRLLEAASDPRKGGRPAGR